MITVTVTDDEGATRHGHGRARGLPRPAAASVGGQDGDGVGSGRGRPAARRTTVRSRCPTPARRAAAALRLTATLPEGTAPRRSGRRPGLDVRSGRARSRLRAPAADAGRDDHARDPGHGRPTWPRARRARSTWRWTRRSPTRSRRTIARASRSTSCRRRRRRPGGPDADGRSPVARTPGRHARSPGATPAAKALALRVKQGRAQLLTNKFDVSVVAGCGPVACSRSASGTVRDRRAQLAPEGREGDASPRTARCGCAWAARRRCAAPHARPSAARPSAS